MVERVGRSRKLGPTSCSRTSTATATATRDLGQDELRARRPGRECGAACARPHRHTRGRRRRRTCGSRSARPAAAPARSTRSRSSTAGAARADRRSTAPTAGTCCASGPVDRPDPAAPKARSRSACSRTSASRSTRAAARHPRRPIDRRVLATLAYLAESGLRPTVTSLQVRAQLPHEVGQRLAALLRQRRRHLADQRHPDARPPGARRHHRPGRARGCMQLQGALAPAADHLPVRRSAGHVAMADHADHIHVGLRPAVRGRRRGSDSVLKPGQWPELIERLSEMPNPIVETGDLSAALTARPRGASAAARSGSAAASVRPPPGPSPVTAPISAIGG